MNNSKISRREVERVSYILYPYLKAELFLKWEQDEVKGLIGLWLDNMVEEGLISIGEDDKGEPCYTHWNWRCR